MPFVVRSTFQSCMTTNWSSFVRLTSSSSVSAPAASASLNAYIVFDGNSSSPPWWAMLMNVRSSSQGLPVPADAGRASSTTSREHERESASHAPER